jgi:hypothetical protein
VVRGDRWRTTPERVLAHLQERGTVWSAPVDQDDQAYAEADWVFGHAKTGRRFARLRTEGGAHRACRARLHGRQRRIRTRGMRADREHLPQRTQSKRFLRASRAGRANPDYALKWQYLGTHEH